MPRKRYSTEQIVTQTTPGRGGVEPRSADTPSLQEAGGQRSDVLPLAKGVRRLAPRPSEAAQGTRRENTRLKKLVADQALDNMILKEVASGNF